MLDKLRGHNITGPVVFDWEVIGKSEARTYGIETGVLCAAANAFCEIIEDAGYDAMIYITDYAGYVKYDLSKVMDYPLWYARYDVSAPTFYYDFAMAVFLQGKRGRHQGQRRHGYLVHQVKKHERR